MAAWLYGIISVMIKCPTRTRYQVSAKLHPTWMLWLGIMLMHWMHLKPRRPDVSPGCVRNWPVHDLELLRSSCLGLLAFHLQRKWTSNRGSIRLYLLCQGSNLGLWILIWMALFWANRTPTEQWFGTLSMHWLTKKAFYKNLNAWIIAN